MTTSMIAPAAQVCAFALGCAAIHNLRAHAALIAHLLTGAMIITAAFVLLEATVIYTPDDKTHFDEITIYAAYSG